MVPNINPFSSHKNILVQLCPTLRDGYKNLSTKKDLDQVQVFLPRSFIACLRRVVFHCLRISAHTKNIPDQLVYVASPAVHSPDDGQSFPRLHPVCGRWKGHKAPSIYQKHPTMPKRGLFDFWIVRPLSIHFKVIWNMEVIRRERSWLVCPENYF